MTVFDILLKNRGITTAAQKKEFLRPVKPEKIPLAQTGIKATALQPALRRVQQALKTKELVYIYGDYDADGICSTAILWEALHGLGARVWPYLPDRTDPVRGLSQDGIDSFKEKPNLIITVDNGISAARGCEYAKKLGIEVIITDHHIPKEKLPPAKAIIHTTKLAGAGVAWFFSRELTQSPAGLDLAAVGTIADMVPLVGVNRSLAKFGLDRLKKSRRPGIAALLKEITPQQISFSLAPRLNAMGRMADSLDALRLLCTNNKAKVRLLAEKLNRVNDERQTQTLAMWEHSRQRVDKQSKLIFLADKSYHEGLVGLVAGRLAEAFNRPAFVGAIGPRQVKFSCRSMPGFSAIAAIRALGNLVLECGGHPLAAGFTAATDKITKIKTELLKQTAKLTKADFAPKSSYECRLDLQAITPEFYTRLQQLEPFGFGNPQPLFLAKQVTVNRFYPVGQDNKHLKLTLQGSTLKSFNAIAFGKGSLAAKLIPGQLADVVYSVEQNSWNNKKSLELKIKEMYNLN